MDPVEYHRSEPETIFGQPSTASSQGYLTPPRPFERRRDSVTSSHSLGSSYCQSFTTDLSTLRDYSVPVTPTSTTSGRSPALLEGDFVEVMQYELQMPIHGLPLEEFKTKPPTDGDHAYSQWLFQPISFISTSQSSSYHYQNGPPQGNLPPVFQGRVNQPDNSDTVIVYPAGVDGSRENDSRALQEFDFEDVSYWSQPQPSSSGTLMPSDVMLDVGMVGAYEKVQTESYQTSDVFEHHTTPIAQSPQEVVFKEEPCDSSTRDDPSASGRLRSRMHVSKTGGKTVKRSSRTEPHTLSVKKSRVQKGRKNGDFQLMPHNQIEIHIDNNVEIDHAARRFRPARSSQAVDRHQCTAIRPDGSRCPQHFARPEHRKRHEKTHSGKKDFTCTIPKCEDTKCPMKLAKKFDRNDNWGDHYWTHVAQPGKGGRNKRWELGVMLSKRGWVTDPKLRDKLRAKWLKLYGSLDVLNNPISEEDLEDCDYDPFL